MSSLLGDSSVILEKDYPTPSMLHHIDKRSLEMYSLEHIFGIKSGRRLNVKFDKTG